MQELKIVNVKVVESVTLLGTPGPPVIVACLEDKEESPLFPFSEHLAYEPVQFVGLSVEEAHRLKRLKDLIWFGEVMD